VVANRLRSGGRVLVSAVNWAEAAGKLRQYGMSPVLVRHALAAADAEIVPFAEPDADAVARLTQQTLALGLSLGRPSMHRVGHRRRSPGGHRRPALEPPYAAGSRGRTDPLTPGVSGPPRR